MNIYAVRVQKKIVVKEDYMLKILNHPCIIRSRGLCVQRTSIYWQLNLLVDYCEGGSLQQLILNDSRPLTWAQRFHIAFDVSSAMRYVHRKGYMHRDLTSMNILLQSNTTNSRYNTDLKAVVADFGLSAKIPKYPHVLQQVGSQNWMAPEVLKEEFYNEKADVFSFGIILCQTILRIDADHDAGLCRTQEFSLDCSKFKTNCPSDVPPDFLKIAFSCSECNYKSRPSFEEISKNVENLISHLSTTGV